MSKEDLQKNKAVIENLSKGHITNKTEVNIRNFFFVIVVLSSEISVKICSNDVALLEALDLKSSEHFLGAMNPWTVYCFVLFFADTFFQILFSSLMLLMHAL